MDWKLGVLGAVLFFPFVVKAGQDISWEERSVYRCIAKNGAYEYTSSSAGKAECVEVYKGKVAIAHDPRWKFVTTSTDDSYVFIDTATALLKSRPLIKVWARYFPPEGKNLPDTKIRYAINCLTNEIRTLQSVSNYPDGSTSANNGSEREWSSPPPGTLVESVVKDACSLDI